MAAMVVETAWLMSSATLMPLDRMRVGINSDSASQTQTPGPRAKNAMNAKGQHATSQPFCSDGTMLMSALSIFSGAFFAASKSANGFGKKAAPLFGGRQPARERSTGVGSAPLERL